MIDCPCGIKLAHQLLKAGENKMTCGACKRKVTVFVRFEEAK